MAEIALKERGIDEALALLKSLPPEVVSKSGGPVKAALRAGARVIQKEAALNIARATDNLSSDEGGSTGLLQSSVITSRGKAPSSGKGERYLVRVKKRVYVRAGEQVTTLKTAQLLEYGSEKQPAEPWIRPAFNAKAETAIRTVQIELVKAIDRVVTKLARLKR
jgi:HK97 gp10 family phage protein